jgi:hypothetical protein
MRDILLAPTFAIATTAGAALFLTHNRARKRLVLGGDIPFELFLGFFMVVPFLLSLILRFQGKRTSFPV